MSGAVSMTRVLVLCIGNTARSQMGEGVLKSPDARLDVQSAGTRPAARVNPFAIRVMREVGIDADQNVFRRVRDDIRTRFTEFYQNTIRKEH
jgi:arsenate reductase